MINMDSSDGSRSNTPVRRAREGGHEHDGSMGSGGERRTRPRTSVAVGQTEMGDALEPAAGENGAFGPLPSAFYADVPSPTVEDSVTDLSLIHI